MCFRVSLSVLIFLLLTIAIGPAMADDSADQSNSSATTTEEQRSIAPAPVAGPPAKPDPPSQQEQVSSPVAEPPVALPPEPSAPPAVAPSSQPENSSQQSAGPALPLPVLPDSQSVSSGPEAKPAEPTAPEKKEPVQSVIPFDVNLSPGPSQPKIEIPEDPCLPGLYKDWQEMSVDSQEREVRNGLSHCRITIDRSSFQLWLEAIRRDGSVDEIYRTHVGLGDVNSPTPEGNFVINHIYCYPDVVYFDASGKKVPGLYNGFFAPLLLCEDRKHCRRYHDLGIHGFQGSAARRHNVAVASLATYGAISAGCIRVSDPCRLKSELIRLVGIGPVKKDDRGTYHWLARPVEVVITGYYPGTEDQTTLASIFEQSLEQVHGGIKDLLSLFGR
jgi:hypothetical protein